MSYDVRPFHLPPPPFERGDSRRTSKIAPSTVELKDLLCVEFLDLEIGCGAGWHPIQYAGQSPHRHLIAIEHTSTKFAHFKSRVDSHPHLLNLHPVQADAILWAARNLPKKSIDRCFILYPNPEPKAPNKRWLRSPFMHRLLEIMKPSGKLILTTNKKKYFDEALLWAEHAWKLECVENRSLSAKDGVSPRSHFEKKYLQRGEVCYEAHWKIGNRS